MLNTARLLALGVVSLGGVIACLSTCHTTYADSPRASVDPVEPRTETSKSYHEMVRRHFDRVLEVGADAYGKDQSALWLASIDLIEGGQNEQVEPKSRRVYRRIHAPRGSNLYWDVPLLVAAYRVSDISGDDAYARGADACVKAFLERCVSEENGLFMWGNHIWYEVFADQHERIGHWSYEARPMPIPWDVFWRQAGGTSERCIRSMGKFHIMDEQTGFFDRHASAKDVVNKPTEKEMKEFYPFIESGAVVVESLCWLANKNPSDREQLIGSAKKVAQFCAKHHGETTGIIRNQGNRDRWDYHHGTTEVGLWANCLLRAAELSGDDSFAEIPQAGLLAFLKYGWDEKAGKYYGSISVDDGSPLQPEKVDPYPYMPDYHSDIWEPLFPIHDYPMAMGEACIAYYERTGREEYRQAIERLVEHIRNSIPARFLSERHGTEWVDGAYAASYGSCIHFLSKAAATLEKPEYRSLAEQLAAEAVDHLYIPEVGAFRSHPGDDTADSVDGLGVLFLALMELESGSDGDLMGFHF